MANKVSKSLFSIVLPMIVLLFSTSLLYSSTAGGRVFTTESERRWRIQTQQPLVSDWQLQDQQGRTFRLSDINKHGVLVNFIFTRCPTICLSTGSQYGAIQQQIKTLKTPITLLSISIDPDYDSPKRLSQYQSRYTDSPQQWIVARPKNQQILNDIKKEVGIKVIPDGLGGFSHSTSFQWIEQQRLKLVVDQQATDPLSLLNLL
jgi:protein SCO1/2